ncbi:hypothetical protein PPYR_09443 [Photinus pyralis]|uniref:Tubulin glycylase 3A n=1 Tax=Photinus pyralis TaxID=7054 RepID=A0A5N4AM82_PHOPY|nr:tubulin glycylase 3A-like [Photinus pyralis]KAB0798450.1 hypothetical protein PPYR_09443 [Photinus pyralis]
MKEIGEITEIILDTGDQIRNKKISFSIDAHVSIEEILRLLQQGLGKWSDKSQERKTSDNDKGTTFKKDKLCSSKTTRRLEKLDKIDRSGFRSKSADNYYGARNKMRRSPRKIESNENPPASRLFLKSLTNAQSKLLNLLRDQAEAAVKCNKTFTVCGNFFTVRKALWARGWVEKIRIMYNTINRERLKSLLEAPIAELLEGAFDRIDGHLHKRVILSRLIDHNQVDLFWDQNFECYHVCNDSIKLTLFNRFKRTAFNYISKIGFSQAMKQKYYWVQSPGTANIRYPRSYDLSNQSEMEEFLRDYRLTAALSLLKHVSNKLDRKRSSQVVSENGQEPMKMYNFAVKEITNAIRRLQHDDIDYVIDEATHLEWNDFLETFHRISHIGLPFKLDHADSVKFMVETSTRLLEEMKQFRPNLETDGTLNVWILKPSNGSRGEGIYLCRTLQYIMKTIRINSSKKYIIQKYVEKPLLIHKTKFDIRQWFLVSTTTRLTIWIYKDCYLRFSSQNYTLNRLNEAIHLTNNSVQSKYRNCDRHQELPTCNMWDSARFQEYLASIGKPNAYKEIIYQGMKQAITAAVLMNETCDVRKRCFEIYGADFILTEDFAPWLIEINNKPALHASTPITARMCPQLLRDVIKVAVDYPQNPDASTGQFELIYQDEKITLPSLDASNLQLQGQQLPISYFYEPHESESHLPLCRSCELDHDELKEAVGKIRQTLQNLLAVMPRDDNKNSEHEIGDGAETENSTNEIGDDRLRCLDTTEILKDTMKSIQDLTKAYNRYTELCTQ